MNRWTQTLLLTKREFVARAKSKVFLVSMAVIALVIIAIGPVISLFADDPEPIPIGIVGVEPAGIEEGLAARAALSEREVEITRYDSVAAAEADLEEGKVEALLVDGTSIVFNEEESFVVVQVITDSVNSRARIALMETLGLTPEEMQQLNDPAQISVRTLVVPDPEERPRRVAAFAGVLVLFGTILTFGQFVAIGTVEEKQNRVVEILLSRVKASQVLVGKVLGIGALGLVQLLVMAAAALVAINIIDIEGISLGSIGAEIVAGVFFWFLLGYTLYAFLYAALGATVSRQEDLQGVLVLPAVFILPAFFIAQLAVADPDLPIVRFGSFFPPWTPMIMPIRMALGSAQPWEVALSIALVVVGIVLLVWIGSRVYTGALLRTGGTVKLRDAWRSTGA
ncbi:MAG: ABC transporter permease [Actinobacteria bacterium]|nr:ABC transporter permease [Actinomycetota bacterium]